jgi:hypothetical protein
MLLGQPYDVMIDKEIAIQAYYRWERRGKPFGSPEIDWLLAVEDRKREEQYRRMGKE